MVPDLTKAPNAAFVLSAKGADRCHRGEVGGAWVRVSELHLRCRRYSPSVPD